MSKQQTISPVNGHIYHECSLTHDSEINQTIQAARTAQYDWQQHTIAERAAICHKALAYFDHNRPLIAEQISWQMGRPIRQSPGEIDGLIQRAKHMINIAPQALAEITPKPETGFNRFIQKDPIGVVFTVAPWNYPLLTTVNSVIPALMAGNTVILKPSAQTPLCGDHFIRAFSAAGLPNGILQLLTINHQQTNRLVSSGLVDFVCFTGSVDAGRSIEQAAAGTFAGVALELGGKDPAYVREDADLDYSVEQLVDGAFFNSGQSCCGIERIYVHQQHYSQFVEAFVAKVKTYKLGNPLDPTTNLGPVVRTSAADWVRQQISQAKTSGAKACIDTGLFAAAKTNSPYLAPQVLIDVDHTMSVMREESFGPVVGIMPVANDAEALALMNDSDLGLTSSLWTQDEQVAIDLGKQLQTGTVFMNRCDYLDPALVWTGVKNTGRGCSLSLLGYEQLTQPKSFHLKRC